MKKGKNSCGMPKIETIFARGEIGGQIFNTNFEWQKDKKWKKAQVSDFLEIIKKNFNKKASKNPEFLLESRFFYLFVTILMHFLVLYSIWFIVCFCFFFASHQFVLHQEIFCSLFLLHFLKSILADSSTLHVFLLRKFIILDVHMISLAVHCIENMYFLLVFPIISLVSYSCQDLHVEIHYTTWCLL